MSQRGTWRGQQDRNVHRERGRRVHDGVTVDGHGPAEQVAGALVMRHQRGSTGAVSTSMRRLHEVKDPRVADLELGRGGTSHIYGGRSPKDKSRHGLVLGTISNHALLAGVRCC